MWPSWDPRSFWVFCAKYTTRADFSGPQLTCGVRRPVGVWSRDSKGRHSTEIAKITLHGQGMVKAIGLEPNLKTRKSSMNAKGIPVVWGYPIPILARGGGGTPFLSWPRGTPVLSWLGGTCPVLPWEGYPRMGTTPPRTGVPHLWLGYPTCD